MNAMNDVLAIWRKELIEIRVEHFGDYRGTLRLLAAFAFAAYFFPHQAGAHLAEPGWLSLIGVTDAALFVITSAGDSIAGERERQTLEALLATPVSQRGIVFGKILAISTFGTLAAAACTSAGIVLYNVLANGVAWVVPGWAAIGVAALAVISATLLATAVGVLASLHASSTRQAQQTYMFMLAGGVAAIALGVRHAPPLAQAAIVHFAQEHPQSGVIVATCAAAVIAAALAGVACAGMNRRRIVSSFR